jgi:predicted phosphodiesterase
LARRKNNQLTHIQKLRQAVLNVSSFDEAVRPLSSDGKPGGLIEFSARDKREFLIVGDLHGNLKNLQAILDDRENLDRLQKDQAVLLFLGDAVHSDKTGCAYEMDSSIETMDLIIELINSYPRNVIYLLGNHDSFGAELAKMGIQQGLIYRDALQKARGSEYVELMQQLFDVLPLFAIHKHFLAVHAGPVRGGITRQELVNVRHFPHCVWQLTWNRLNETRSTPSMKEYGPEELDEARRLLHCPPSIPFIVGHNPMWKWTEDDSIWINALGIPNHVILVTSLEKKCPYLVFRNSPAYEVRYANLHLQPRRFVLDDYR